MTIDELVKKIVDGYAALATIDQREPLIYAFQRRFGAVPDGGAYEYDENGNPIGQYFYLTNRERRAAADFLLHKMDELVNQMEYLKQ